MDTAARTKAKPKLKGCTIRCARVNASSICVAPAQDSPRYHNVQGVINTTHHASILPIEKDRGAVLLGGVQRDALSKVRCASATTPRNNNVDPKARCAAHSMASLCACCAMVELFPQGMCGLQFRAYMIISSTDRVTRGKVGEDRPDVDRGVERGGRSVPLQERRSLW